MALSSVSVVLNTLIMKTYKLWASNRRGLNIKTFK
jgi:hypothetical protein